MFILSIFIENVLICVLCLYDSAITLYSIMYSKQCRARKHKYIVNNIFTVCFDILEL